MSVGIIFFTVAMVLFMGLELHLHLRERGRGDDSQDAGSLKTIAILRHAAFIIALVAAFFPLLPLPGGRPLQLNVGAALILSCLVLRAWAMGKLGASFTSAVMTRAGQKLITDGPYKFVRHPAYSGALLFYLGLGTASGSVVGLGLIMIVTVYAFHRRMQVEERVLSSWFGEEYIAYMNKTKRIIPFLY